MEISEAVPTATLASADGAPPDSRARSGGFTSTIAVVAVAEAAVRVPQGHTARWSLSEKESRQVDVCVQWVPDGPKGGDVVVWDPNAPEPEQPTTTYAYARHVSCWGSHMAEEPGTLVLRLSNEFSWRTAKTVRLQLSASPGAGASTPAAGGTRAASSAAEEGALKAALDDLAPKLAQACEQVAQLSATNAELRTRMSSEAQQALRGEIARLRAQLAELAEPEPEGAGAAPTGDRPPRPPMAAARAPPSVHDLLVEHGLVEFEDRLIALGATAAIHLAQLDESDVASLGVSEVQRVAFESMLMKCEPPPVVEDSLVRVSSAAEKRSQDAAEELQRQRSNQTNPDAETAASDDSEILTRVNTLQLMAARLTPQLSDGEQECSICMESHESATGVKCTGDETHYVCLSCTCLYVESQVPTQAILCEYAKHETYS